jgi:hypothetical protein
MDELGDLWAQVIGKQGPQFGILPKKDFVEIGCQRDEIHRDMFETVPDKADI